jgi:thioredoxin 1
MAIEFKKDSFEEEVLKSDIPVLVDFWAPWCGPCQMMGPIVEELSSEMGDKAKVGKINIDENGEIAEKYGVMSIPTIIIFKDGEIAQQMVGVQSKDALKESLEKLA